MKNEKKQAERLSLAFLFAMVVFFLWSGSWGLMKMFIEPQDRGEFGDQFGAVNALFSGLGFSALVYTIYLQRIEIKQTQKEMVEQNQTSSLQRFENSFFNLLNLLGETINQSQSLLRNENGEMQMYRGRQIFCRVNDIIGSEYKATKMYPNEPFPFDVFIIDIQRIIKTSDGVIDQYFNIVHQIVSFVKNSNVTNDQKKSYLGILNSLISEEELLLLFYDFIWSKNGMNAAATLVELKYPFFQNIIWQRIIHGSMLKKADLTLFGESDTNSFMNAYDKEYAVNE